jgi:hypothetical protein
VIGFVRTDTVVTDVAVIAVVVQEVPACRGPAAGTTFVHRGRLR